VNAAHAPLSSTSSTVSSLLWSITSLPIGIESSCATAIDLRIPFFLSRCGEWTITTMSCFTASSTCQA